MARVTWRNQDARWGARGSLGSKRVERDFRDTSHYMYARGRMVGDPDRNPARRGGRRFRPGKAAVIHTANVTSAPDAVGRGNLKP